MTSMLECCLSGAILERKRNSSLLAAGHCLCGCVVARCGLLNGHRTWIARRPSFGNQTVV